MPNVEARLQELEQRVALITVHDEIMSRLMTSGMLRCHYGANAERLKSTDYQDGVMWWGSDNDELYIGTGSGWQDIGGAAVGGAHTILDAVTHADTNTQAVAAHTVIAANAAAKYDAVTVAEQTVVGRLTGGAVDDITIGIANNNMLQVDGSPNDDEYARFTPTGLEGRTAAEARTDLGLIYLFYISLGNEPIDGQLYAP